MSGGQADAQVSAKFMAAWLFPVATARAAEIAAKKELAEGLGIHDEALRLARTTAYSYSEWVDRLALAIAAGRSLRENGRYGSA